MKISNLWLLPSLATSVLAFTRGDICNDPGLANTGCQSTRTSCYAACNGQIASGLFGCRAQCNAECDQCTQSLGGATAGAQYQSCMNNAKTCLDEQKCAIAKNNLRDHCESLANDVLKSPPWISEILDPEGCGAQAAVPSCPGPVCRLPNQGCRQNSDCCSNNCSNPGYGQPFCK